jgi:hypothetical protein
MMAGTVIFASVTYLIMVVTYYLARFRRFHVTVMASIMVIDFFFPVYLYLTHNWAKRLIDHEEIFSFLIWMHFILVLTLYVLYVFQIMAGRKILRGDEAGRSDHKAQAKGILVAKALVIITGALLVEPDAANH